MLNNDFKEVVDVNEFILAKSQIITIRINPIQHAIYHKFCRENKLHISELVRISLDTYLSNYTEKEENKIKIDEIIDIEKKNEIIRIRNHIEFLKKLEDELNK